jgi:hypothetical protein
LNWGNFEGGGSGSKSRKYWGNLEGRWVRSKPGEYWGNFEGWWVRSKPGEYPGGIAVMMGGDLCIDWNRLFLLKII